MKPHTAALLLSLLAPALTAPVSSTNNGQIENNYAFADPAGAGSAPTPSASGDNSSGGLSALGGEQGDSGVKNAVHEVLGNADSLSKRDPQGMGMGGGSSPFGSMSGMGSGGSGGSSSGSVPMPGMGSGGSSGSSSGSMPMAGGKPGGSGGSSSGSMPMPGIDRKSVV